MMSGKLTVSVLLYLFAWLVIAVIAATTAFIGLGGSSFRQWLGVLGIMLEFFYVWAAIGFGIYWLQQRFSSSKKRLFLQALAHISLLAVILASMPFLIHGSDWPSWLYGERAAAFHSLNVLIYAFVLIGCKLLEFYRQGRARERALFEAELRRVELERSLESSRMDALRAQVNPHFLFNTLNSLASLIEMSSNREAYEVVERLADLLRSALDYSRDKLVSLEEELEFLDAYLAIEKIRYGDRLQVSKSIPQDCLVFDVPSFSLQPLVENSIKHAVSQSSAPVTIDIDARCREHQLILTISDDGPGFDQPVHAGVGLTNIRSRLDFLFGNDASLMIGGNNAGGATVKLVVPCTHGSPNPSKKKRRDSQISGTGRALEHVTSSPGK
jgi:sensor histidine kinase YesM